MLIDWFTVAAQIINFLILVALLKYFLFDPLLKRVDIRKKEIQDNIEEAERKSGEAAGKQEKYEMKLKEIEREKASMLAAAKKEAEDEKHTLMEQARNAVASQKEEWLEVLEKEKQNNEKEIRIQS